MSTLTGTGALTRFALRRDRVRIAVWIAAIVLLVVTTAASTKGLYPTQHDLDQAAAASEDNPAALAFNGPAVALDTLGGQVAFQVGAIGLVVVGLMALLLVGRLTRTEEESGRLELIRSMGVGRHAPLASGLLVVSAMCVVVGVLVTASLLSQDLPTAGSVVLGVSFTVLGLVFVGLAGVTAQVTENPRVASGLAGAVLGVSFAVRAIGDVGDGTVSWFSPIGLVQKTRPYADDRWWPLLVAVAIAAGLVAAAASLASHRDFGGGLVAPRPGPPVADDSLLRPLGLAVRLQRPAILWWAFAMLLTGVAYGSIADSIEEFVADNEAMADVIAASGGASLTDSYLGTSLLILALVAGGAALQSTLRLRSEEAAGRSELLLATPTSRSVWMRDHVVVALVGSAFTVVTGGFGIGATYGLVIGDLGQVPRLMAASLVYVPAVWTFIGVAVALFGVVPRLATATWALLAGALVVALFGTVLGLPAWVLDLSPFEHVPQMPAAGLSVVPLVVLSAFAAAATGLGFAGFRRRDVS
jgi:ABC-2 type transport system permease protein